MALVLCVGWFAHVQAREAAPPSVRRVVALSGGDLSERGLDALAAAMDPAMRTLARRIAPAPEVVLAGGAPIPGSGLGPDPTAAPPPLGWRELTPDLARLWNAGIPVSAEANPAARPFFLKAADLLDANRALDCLTAAVYYEAGYESLEGQQAVAQVVLNRMRHPAYPKTVCGVVFQGAARTTGCQFTFTCDGSLNRTPQPAIWRRARQVAAAALDGFVMTKVGSATHYHADYVAPYWAPTLTKVAQIGAHIFYRWNGGEGRPGAFTGLWAGGEPALYQTAFDPGAGAAVTLEPAVLEVASLDTPALISDAPEPAQSEAAPEAPVADAAPAVAAPAAAAPAKPEKPRRARETGWSRLPVRSDW
ncbi:cell wall hydrolase [Caulobacter sp. 17J80-11]|nr:cell wall hydrolase [Caulobacter sp. 17J80-11]